MIALFQKEEHQQFFEKNGYLKLNVLEQDDVSQLLEFFNNSGIRKVTDYGFYVGMDNEDKDLVGVMMNRIKEVAIPRISPYLKDFQLFTASYVLKNPSPKGVVPPHQDWSFVEDEERHFSVTCWIPLVDVNMENGCLGIINGSHKFFGNIRPSPSPQSPSPLQKHLFTIFPYIKLIEMKAGEALFFDNRTIHASPPNTTDECRVAVGLGFTQAEAEIRHYYLKPGTKDTLLKYEVTPGFFQKYDNNILSRMYDKGEVIEGQQLLGEVPYSFPDWDKAEISRRIEEEGNVYDKALAKHMSILFAKEIGSGLTGRVKSILSAFRPSNILHKIKSVAG